MDIQSIHNEARQAAINAENAHIAKHGESYYCGFAWVDVFVERTNSKEAKELVKIGFKKSWRPKTMNLWSPGGYNGQSMDIKEAGASAYAEVLSKYGFRAYCGSRPD